MSNAMRKGKRTLAGVAAAALGLALVPFVGVGAASATSISSVALDGPLRAGTFTQSATVTGVDFDDTTQALVIIPAPTNPGTVTIATPTIDSATEATFTVSNPTEAGTYTLRACVTLIADTACATPVAQRNLTFTTTGIPTGLVLTPASATTGAAVAETFTVEIRDAGGNRTQAAAAETVAVSTTVTGGTASVLRPDLQTGLQATGTGTFTVANNTAGTTTTVTVAPTGSFFGGTQTATLTTGTVVAAATVALTSPVPNASNEIPAGTTPVVFTITRDAADTGAFVSFTATNATPASGTVPVGADGTVNVSLAVTNTAATQTVSLTAGGSTATATFRNPAAQFNVPASTITAAPGSTVTISGTLTDQFGNNLANAAVSGGVTAGPNSGTATTNALTNAQGAFSVSYTAALGTAGQSDTVDIEALFGGSLVGPLTITVSLTESGAATLDTLTLAGVAPADFASIVQVPFTGTAGTAVNGTSASTGNVVELVGTADVSGVAVTYSVTGGFLSTTGSTQWNEGESTLVAASGASVYFFSTTVGTATVTATAGSNVISAPITIAATPQDGARNIAVEAVPDRQVIGGSSNITVAVTDVFGNPVALTGTGPSLSMSTDLGALAGGVSVFTTDRTNADGLVTVSLTSSAGGTATVTVLATGGQFATTIPEAPAPTASGAAVVQFGSVVDESITIEGSRDNRRINVTGTTEGIEDGTVVKPWLRFPGQTGFTEGAAQRVVTDGEFAWGRNTGKRTAVQIRTLDGLRSNTVIIAAR